MTHLLSFSGGHLVPVVVYYAIEALIWVIIIDAILTFIPSLDRRNPLVILLRSICEPIYRPVRRLIPHVRLGDAVVDLSPIALIVGLHLIRLILLSVL